MCNKTAYKMLIKHSYNYTVHNGLFCIRPLRTCSTIKHPYCTLNRLENKSLPQLPLKTLPMLLNKSVECSIIPNSQCNFYCTENKTPLLPKLMDFPEIAWPSIIKSIRNWILTRFIIMRHFDNEFDLGNFTDGSKKAVEVVSGILSQGEVTNLDGLISSDILPEIKSSLSSFSMAQRQQLEVIQEDIYFSFPYEVGVIFPNENEEEDRDKQQIFVEITMCYHVLKGLKDMKNSGENIPLNVGVMPEYREKIVICNYRFIREFTKGVTGEWVINALNHFKPADQLSQ